MSDEVVLDEDDMVVDDSELVEDSDLENLESEDIDDGDADELIDSNDSDEAEGENSQPEESDEDELVVTIDGQESEEDQAKAPRWVRELRKSNREKERENRELKNKLKAFEEPSLQIGQKPTIEDFDYDPEAYAEALVSWELEKTKIDELEANKKLEEDRAAEEWQQKLQAYNVSKANLKVRDFEDAESVVLSEFSQTQQGIIVQGSENPAKLVYALGKNPSKTKELAGMDPVKFAFSISKLEDKVNMSPKKAPPPPEKSVKGSGSKSAVNSTLDKLRAEARKTGDFTKVTEYRQKLKNKK